MSGKSDKSRVKNIKKYQEKSIKIRWGFDRKEKKSRGNKKAK
jgi:hypothetical protein